MTKEKISAMLLGVKSGEIEIQEALKTLETLPFEDLGFATIDHHRAIRVGVPEVIYAEGKTETQVYEIAKHILENGQSVLATRVSKTCGDSLEKAFDKGFEKVRYNPVAQTVFISKENHDQENPLENAPYIAIVAAGTSDLPVVEEAYETARALGNRVEKVVDVGVAGIHRLFAKLDVIRGAKVVIVVAGMEGALASVVGGLVDKPVIAVPTSVGYGASFGGISALLTMLNSCSSGVTVVNIDNGFGAAYAASQINHL